MSKSDKRLRAMRHNAKAVRPSDLYNALESDGWTMEHNGTSHRVYRKEGIGQLSIPHRTPFLKECYVKQALAMIGEDESHD